MRAGTTIRRSLWRWRRNPLRRREDVLEAWILLIVWLVVALAGPWPECWRHTPRHTAPHNDARSGTPQPPPRVGRVRQSSVHGDGWRPDRGHRAVDGT